jgi:sortase A
VVVARTESPRTARSRRRGPAFWAGVALIVVGLLLLGYVAWQLFGTNVVSHRKQARIVEDTVRIWSGKAKAEDLHGAEALVRIPAFGKKYVVPVQPGTSENVLAEGFGHFRGTARPGRVGNFAIAGHRVTHGEPLRDMPSLRPGDTVVVDTRTRTFTYRLDTDPNDLVVDLDNVWVLDPLPHNPRGGVQPAQRRGQQLITLTTCSELFHTDNRSVAFGHLVDTTLNGPR